MSSGRFPPELRTASFVPRWSVVWSLTRDSLTNHSFFVALYAHQIARLIEWSGDYGALLFYALTHDLEELATGDIVGPAKRHIVDAARYEEFCRAQMLKRFPDFVKQLDALEFTADLIDIRRIVKCADKLDVVLFLTMEERLGNKIVHERAQEGIASLRKAWLALPSPIQKIPGPEGNQTDHIQWLEDRWSSEVLSAIEHHRKHGGIGI